jgi:tyrosine-protein kinase Etk/Wzc
MFRWIAGYTPQWTGCTHSVTRIQVSWERAPGTRLNKLHILQETETQSSHTLKTGLPKIFLLRCARAVLLEAKENLTTTEEAMKSTEQSTGVLQIGSQARYLTQSAAALRAQVVTKLQAMRSYSTKVSPETAIAEPQQLAAFKTQLCRLAGDSLDSGSDMIVPKRRDPQTGTEYGWKLCDVKYYETISELIAKQFEMGKLDTARQGAVVQVVDPAVSLDMKSFPKRMLSVVAVTLSALIAACTW